MNVQGQLQLRVNIIFDPEKDRFNLKLILRVCLLIKHGHNSPVRLKIKTISWDAAVQLTLISTETLTKAFQLASY